MKPRILNMATYSAGLAALLCLLGQGVQAADSCLNCHSDQAKLQALIKQHQLEKESLSVEQQSLQLLVSQTDMGSHAELGCRDCHSKADKPEAEPGTQAFWPIPVPMAAVSVATAMVRR